MARFATERVVRGLNRLGVALVVTGALVVVGGIALTHSIEALVTAASVAVLAFGVPGAAAFAFALWLEYAAERVERQAISALHPGDTAVPRAAETALQYGIAVAAVLCAWGLRAALDTYVPDEVPFITFYLAVAIAGWLGGFGPSVAAIALSAAIAGSLYVRPESSTDVGHFVLLALFFLVCLGIAAIASALHDALARAHDLARLLEQADDGSRPPGPAEGLLAEEAPVPLFVTNAAHGCMHCNRAWLALRGRELAQERGSGWWEGVHPDDVARRQEAFAAAIATRGPHSVAYRLRHADGSYREMRDTVVAQIDARGNPVGLLGASSEVAPPGAASPARPEG